MELKKMLWAIEAWIHPNEGGDDFPLTWTLDTTGYSNGLSDIKKVSKMLIKEQNSAVLNDFRISLNGKIVYPKV